jgi:hypothetical protein
VRDAVTRAIRSLIAPRRLQRLLVPATLRAEEPEAFKP